MRRIKSVWRQKFPSLFLWGITLLSPVYTQSPLVEVTIYNATEVNGLKTELKINGPELMCSNTDNQL